MIERRIGIIIEYESILYPKDRGPYKYRFGSKYSKNIGNNVTGTSEYLETFSISQREISENFFLSDKYITRKNNPLLV